MQDAQTLIVDEVENDFATLLEQSFAVEAPQRGDIVNSTILTIDSQGMIVDIGMERDAVIARHDLDQLGEDKQFEVGQEVPVMIVNLEDSEGNLVVSAAQARQLEDWERAEALMEADEIWEGTIAAANRGGLIIPFGHLRGFVPASHVMDLPRGLSENERQDYMSRLVGHNISVKVIEVNRRRRRLVLSQREAQTALRANRKDILLEELAEGEVRTGVVSGLRDFGAFVDLGGADGLIHISELAWHRVRHPREILSVGDEIEVFILRLDTEGKRIGLSLKRLQPNPWAMVDQMYHVGQLVEGQISRVTQFGAFISLPPGVEALLHTSQMADPAPEDPGTMVSEGQTLLMRVISIEPERQRLGLSLKEVTAEEQTEWLAKQLDAAEVVNESGSDAAPSDDPSSEAAPEIEPEAEQAQAAR